MLETSDADSKLGRGSKTYPRKAATAVRGRIDYDATVPQARLGLIVVCEWTGPSDLGVRSI
jgi:hypothetical protein